MGNIGKKLLAWLLILTLSAGAADLSAAAKEPETASAEDTGKEYEAEVTPGEVEIEAENSFGGLLANTLEESGGGVSASLLKGPGSPR